MGEELSHSYVLNLRQTTLDLSQNLNSPLSATASKTESPSELATTFNFSWSHLLCGSGIFSVLTATASGHATRPASFGDISRVRRPSLPGEAGLSMKNMTSPHSSLDTVSKFWRIRVCFQRRCVWSVSVCMRAAINLIKMLLMMSRRACWRSQIEAWLWDVYELPSPRKVISVFTETDSPGRIGKMTFHCSGTDSAHATRSSSNSLPVWARYSKSGVLVGRLEAAFGKNASALDRNAAVLTMRESICNTTPDSPYLAPS